ncbi:MAG: putative motility protein [Spirochaetaceae bacterium]|jgi:hypothetical protein|nr:putative motility protein [Spirochaetaceae bacterium]
MNIEQLSVGFYLQQTREQAAVQVQSMVLDEAQTQGDALSKLLEKTGVFTDPNVGNIVNILA